MNRRHALFFAATFLLFPLGTLQAAEEPKVWGALILGGADLAVAGSDSAQFQEIRGRLSKEAQLRFSEYVLLGEETQAVPKEFDTWVVPSKEIFLELDYKGSDASGMKFFLRLWHKETVKTKADVVLTPDQPLLIRGPQWKGGYLIFALDLVN
ncbi:MAG: hypothetical protein AAF555_07370 [Verrucomicrobiota bacterium]